MLRLLMYFMPFDAPGAEILMDLPAGSAISARSNSGVLTVRSGVPGVIGYRPRAAQTYQLDSAPRSSLPGSPPGVGRNKSLRTRSTVSWVFHGWPRWLYSHGTPKPGSFPIQRWGSFGP